MKKLFALTEDERLIFRKTVSGTKPIHHDRVARLTQRCITTISPYRRILREQINASFYFTEKNQVLLDNQAQSQYARPNTSLHDIKKLRHGYYVPKLFLDLHGLTRKTAKQELGALIAACQRELINCACIMHGHGKHILKQQMPIWLAQHPDLLCFHQAPKKFGGSAALLILVELNYL